VTEQQAEKKGWGIICSMPAGGLEVEWEQEFGGMAE